MNKLTIMLVIAFMGCLSQFGADIYTPSIPAIAKSLHTPLSLVQLTLAVYLFGVAISQLFYGPLSEGLGRKKPMLIGMFIYLIGTAVAFSATDISVLLIGRLIQGLGVGACACLWRATFRDLFVGDDMAKYASYFGTVIIFIVPVAPVLGGYFQEYLSWRASFAFLFAYAALTFLMVKLLFKETSTHHDKSRLKITHILGNYKTLFRCRLFLGNSLSALMTYGAFFSWFVVGSVLLIHRLGYTPVQFAWITFVIGGITVAVAGIVHGKLVVKFGGQRMLAIGWTMMLLSGVAMAIAERIWGINIWAICIPMAVFYFFSTFIWPNTFAGAFKPHGTIAGNAAALYGCFQLGGGAIFGVLAAHLPTNSQMPLAMVIIVGTVLAVLVYGCFRKTFRHTGS